MTPCPRRFKSAALVPTATAPLEWPRKENPMPVDSFKYLPGSIAAYYRAMAVQKTEPVPFTPLAKPLSESRFALVTTAGITSADDTPFDQEGERSNPMWGDPSYRRIPRDLRQSDIRAWHLHINNRDILADVN